MDVKHPEVKVQLVGTDPNAFSELGICRRAAVRAGLKQDEINQFMDEATSGDYDHLLGTCMQWFDVS